MVEVALILEDRPSVVDSRSFRMRCKELVEWLWIYPVLSREL